MFNLIGSLSLMGLAAYIFILCRHLHSFHISWGYLWLISSDDLAELTLILHTFS